MPGNIYNPILKWSEKQLRSFNDEFEDYSKPHVSKFNNMSLLPIQATDRNSHATKYLNTEQGFHKFLKPISEKEDFHKY